MNMQEIAAINFRAWRKCVEAQEYTKAQTYSKHLGALGHEALIVPDDYILLKEENPVPATRSQRYQMAAYQLRWHDRGVSYGIRLRMQYLALLLDTLAHQLQHHPLSFTLDWINTQLDYEETHNVYAHRLLTRVKAHLTREQK
jgi:hypothetical protein